MSFINTIKFITNHPLNRDQKFGSIARFIKWQIGSRLVPGTIVFDWINESKFLVKHGETGLTGNIYTGLHEFQDMAFLLHFLRDDDLFVDVGANVGTYTILACSAIGAKGIAFEPVPNTFNRLLANMWINHIDQKVKCLNKGVGSKEDNILFTSRRDTTNHALADGEQCENAVNVQVSTLDTELKNEYPQLIKIDVEGFETPVLKGAQKTLEKESLNAVIMELNGSGERYGYDELKILELMFEYGFRTYIYEPFNRSLKDLGGKNVDSGNTLFIRDKSLTEDRLNSAPQIDIGDTQL